MVAAAGSVVLGGSRAPFDAWEAQFATSQPRLHPAGPEPLSVESAAIALEKIVGPRGAQLFPHAFRETLGERDYVPSWTELDAGSDLAYELSGQALSQLGAAGVVAVAQGCAKMIAHDEARLAEALAELAPRPEYASCENPGEVHEAQKVAASEVSLALSWTPSHADAQVAEAVELVDELPATLNALRLGRIDRYKAHIIAEETAGLDEGARVEVEREALRAARDKTGSALRSFVKRAVRRADPQRAEDKREKARQTRRASKPCPIGDGLSAMEIVGPTEDLAALFTAADAAARARRDAAARASRDHQPHLDAGVTLEALRFDVLADMAWSALNAGHLGCCNAGCSGATQPHGTRHGRAAAVNVTVPFSTLIGLDDEPAELAGYGPVSAEVARRIAAEGTWRRILTDPASGAVLDYGTTRYVPPQHLSDHVIARDVTCRFPTCSWTAEACQLDHTIPFETDGAGGPTADHNLGAFHHRHHNDKTHHGFEVSQPEPGRFVITTPAGLTYHVDPEAVGPILDLHTADVREASPPTSRPRPPNDGDLPF